MFQIVITREFSAAHALKLPNGEMEPLHGHNWPVDVTIEAADLDELETVMDFHILERDLDAILKQLNNRNVNDVGPFVDCKINPSAERIAQWIGQLLIPTLPKRTKLVSVRIGEAPGCKAVWLP